MKVLVLIARGLQAGVIGPYGNLWVETPTLDRLAAEGVVFDQHFADAASPEGARRAWRSGRYCLPASRDPGPPAPEPPPDLLACLRRRGVHTCLILDGSRPTPADFETGWDRVERLLPDAADSPLEAVLAAVQEALSEGLAGVRDWLLWVDLATPLPPWHVPEDFQQAYFSTNTPEEDEEVEEEDSVEEEEKGEPLTPLPEPAAGQVDPADDTLFLRLHSSYAAAVTYLDTGIGSLLDGLTEADSEDLVMLVTSDCGQALGDHGVVGPVRAWAHNEVLHLPLLLRLPGAVEAGRRVAALTQAVDLAPTLADLFEVDLPGAHGHSLLPLAQGEVEEVRAHACAGVEAGPAVEWALRTPDWAFLLPVRPHPDEPARGPQLFVKPDDRWEVNNVIQHHLELAEGLEKTLRDFVAATREPGPVAAPPLPEQAQKAEDRR